MAKTSPPDPPQYVRVPWPNTYVSSAGKNLEGGKGYLYRLVENNGHNREALMNLVKRMADMYAIDVEDIFGKSRVQYISEARFLVWQVMHDEWGWSLPRIGSRFKRDHTSILYGVRRARQILEELNAQDNPDTKSK